METTHREDCTLMAWYRSLYAPRTGGAHDSHYRTAGIAGRTRQRRSRVAARGARAAAGAAGGRVFIPSIARSIRTPSARISPGPEGDRLHRGREHLDRIPLGRG